MYQTVVNTSKATLVDDGATTFKMEDVLPPYTFTDEQILQQLGIKSFDEIIK